jgi:hypothetical protein
VRQERREIAHIHVIHGDVLIPPWPRPADHRHGEPRPPCPRGRAVPPLPACLTPDWGPIRLVKIGARGDDDPGRHGHLRPGARRSAITPPTATASAPTGPSGSSTPGPGRTSTRWASTATVGTRWTGHTTRPTAAARSVPVYGPDFPPPASGPVRVLGFRPPVGRLPHMRAEMRALRARIHALSCMPLSVAAIVNSSLSFISGARRISA